MANRDNFDHQNPPDKADGLVENIESPPYFPEDTSSENSSSYYDTNWNENDYSAEQRTYEDFPDQTSSQGVQEMNYQDQEMYYQDQDQIGQDQEMNYQDENQIYQEQEMIGQGMVEDTSTENKNKSVVPTKKISKFKAQKLAVWQPIITTGSIPPVAFPCAVVYIAIGAGILFFDHQVKEVSYDYTNCTNLDGKLCHEIIDKDPMALCSCEVDLPAADFGKEDWDGDTFIYYALTEFYQNHRRYVISRDDKQLLGNINTEVDPECAPFDKPKNDIGKFYAPCGAIANSLFSDKIILKFKKKTETKNKFRPVQVSRKNIALDSDKGNKFKNPELKDGKTLREVFEEAGAVKPRDWRLNIWELDLDDPDNNGFMNEDLIVWMRSATLPNFRKLYRRIDHNNEGKKLDHDPAFAGGFPVVDHDFKLSIEYRFRVKHFGGTKSVIISTTSFLGGKNPFLGFVFILLGCICLILGVTFLFIHRRYGPKLSTNHQKT